MCVCVCVHVHVSQCVSQSVLGQIHKYLYLAVFKYYFEVFVV